MPRNIAAQRKGLNPMPFAIESVLASSDFANKHQWMHEARFGYEHLHTYVDSLGKGAKILEVGCGSGILLSYFSEKYPDLNFEGIEPFGDGFSSLQELNDFTKKQGIKINNCFYEDYTPSKQYDLIYLVNVLEHLTDWRHFLSTVHDWLSDKGVCVFLCPNYSFPYEPHFRIPIIISKGFSYSLFKDSIERIEQTENCAGLWESLNLVKKREVFSYCKKLGLIVEDRTEIIDQMIIRLTTDEEFKKRQKLISRLALLLHCLKITRLFRYLPLSLLSPYMMLEVRKQTGLKS